MKNEKECKRDLYEINNLEPIDLYVIHSMGKNIQSRKGVDNPLLFCFQCMYCLFVLQTSCLLSFSKI